MAGMPRTSRPFFARKILFGLAVVAGIASSLPGGRAEAKVNWDFVGKIDGIFAEHTSDPVDPASERLFVLAREKVKFNRRWSAVGTVQGWYEGIYSTDLSYPPQVRQADFYEARMQETYLQYQTSNFIVRAGNQQEVWGETFGNFYADVVNPKDLRQGIPLDQSQIRMAIPALTVRYIRKRFSIEGLYLPEPVFNILPLPGSDYSVPLGKLTGYPTVVINRELYKQWFTNGGETGARISQTLGVVDLSAFYFDAYDRNPYYGVAVNTVPGVLLSLNEQHWRMSSMGMSMAADLGGFILRAEAVLNEGKVVPITAADGSLSRVQTTELAYAASLDFPTWGRLNTTVQYSSSHLGDNVTYLLRPQDENYVGLHLNLGLGESSNLETSLTYATTDQGLRAQAEFMTPFSSSTEIRGGIENYGGADSSEFGRLPRASRVYVLLRIRLSS